MNQLSAKFGQYLLTFISIISLNFFLVHLMPGDPLVHLLGEENYLYLHTQRPQALEALKAKYGLNSPLYKQYLRYLATTLRGDLGWSYHYGQPVLRVILFRLKWTLVLLVPAISIGGLLGGMLGALAGWKRGQKIESLFTSGFLFLYAVPSYCLGLLLLMIFAFYADLFPLGGMGEQSFPGSVGLLDTLWHMCLPLAVLVLNNTGYNYIVMRSAVREVLQEDYVLTAISKGLKERQVLFGHVFKNALPPLITVVALDFGFIAGGALLVEIVFSWQGIGTLIYDALLSRDYPLLSGSFFVLTACVILANALADLSYAIVDPRVRDGGAIV